MFGSKKEFVVFGCSMVADYITHKNNQIDKSYYLYNTDTRKWVPMQWENKTPFPTFTDILAEEYEMIPKNLAVPGLSNDDIFDEMVDYVSVNRNKIGFISLNWTNQNRFCLKNKFEKATMFPYDNFERHEYIMNVQHAMDKLGAFDPKNKMDDDLRLQYIAQEFLYSMNIPFVMSSAICTTFSGHTQIDVSKYMLESDYFDLIHQDTYYGWPVQKELGGIFLADNVCVLGGGDKHPNEKGHQQMAEVLKKFIDENGLL